jgi:kumamolisin
MSKWNLQTIVCVSFLLLTAPLAGASKPDSKADGADSLARLLGHVLPALAKAKAVASQSKAVAEEPLTLTLVLQREDQAGFECYLRDVYDPKSPNYRRFLTPRELADRFGPSREAYDEVLNYLQDHGFTLVEGSANRQTLMVRGTRTEAERAFEVRISDYELAERRFYANDRDPALPSQLAARVQAIAGLSNLAEPQTTGRELTLPEKIGLGCSVAIAVFGAVGIFAWWFLGIVAAVCFFIGAESIPGAFNIPHNLPPLPRFGLAAASAPAPSAATAGLGGKRLFTKSPTP